jgi:hypothetical protein
MNEPLRPYVLINPGQATACREYQLLKQGYESGLRERHSTDAGVRLHFNRQFDMKVGRKPFVPLPAIA